MSLHRLTLTSAEGRTCNVPDGEIAAIAILMTPQLPSPVVAVSTWSSMLTVCCIKALATTQTEYAISVPAVASSLLLKMSNSNISSTSGCQLLAGLSDGGFVTYELEPSDDISGISVLAQKTSSLGTRPLRLCPVDDWTRGEETVVAIGLTERMSVIFEARDRIDFSSVSRKVSDR